MRMSCNGCRVLRKGCSEKCTIRPCLEWIRSPEAQANATVFLAKFYGRAGLVNLINAGPPNLRPAILKSLLYEACGRIVNPITGSVGLLCSGTWKRCQDAVDAVLAGSPITDIVASDESDLKVPYDIRHVSNKNKDRLGLNQVQSRRRFKRSGKNRERVNGSSEEDRSPSHHGSSLSHQSVAAAETNVERGSSSSRDSPCRSSSEPIDDGEMDLNLTLGLEPVKRCGKHKDLAVDTGDDTYAATDTLCKMELRLQFPVS